MRSVAVNVYEKWINDGKNSSRLQGVGRLHVTKENRCRRLFRMVLQNLHQTMAHLTVQDYAGLRRSVPEHTIRRTLLDMGQRSGRRIRVLWSYS